MLKFWKFYQKFDAPPGGTGIAARRQYSDVDTSGRSGLEVCFRILGVWFFGNSVLVFERGLERRDG